MSRFVNYIVPFNSCMVDGQTIIEIPVEEISSEILDSLHAHIEGVFPELSERDVIHAVHRLVDLNVKNTLFKMMVPYKGKRKTTERTELDEAQARYNHRGFDYVDDIEED